MLGPSVEHFLFADETTWGTFVAPDKALPVQTAQLASRRQPVVLDVTGYGRDQADYFMGEKPVTGQLVLPAYPNYIATLLKTFLTAVVSTQQGATTAYRHKLLFDDTAELGSFSAELQYGDARSHFAKGVKIAGLTLSCKAKEAAILTLDLVAEDEAWNGDDWEDGTAAPANPTDPVPYPAAIVTPFHFTQGQLLAGGSLALTDGEIVVSGGSARGYVEACEISIALDEDPVWVINNTPLAGALRELGKNVTLKMDVDWVGADHAYTQDHRDAAETVLQLHFEGGEADTGYNYEMVATLPRVVPQDGTPPDISGSKGRRTQTVNYKALRELTTTEAIFGLVIQNTETTI